MPFFGNILPTLRSYSGIEYPPGQRLRLHFAFAAERPGSGKRLMTCPGAIVQSLCLRFAEWQVTEYKYRLPACSDVNI
jgi:hypothetical protein